VASALVLLGTAVPASSQELEPRAYRPLPVGLNFGQLSYTYSSGNVLVDATAPVEGLNLDIHIIMAAYLRTFSLAGRSSSVSIGFPYVIGSGSARFNGERIEGDRAASADVRARLVVNLLGGPALSPKEFAQRPPGRSLGVGLVVSAPTGQHNSRKIVNFGANRWGAKPEIGYSHVRERWITDITAGFWVFTDNDEFIGGPMSQDPIGSFQFHLSRTFDNGMWLAFDANYFSGGRTTVNGVELDNLQSNSRVGMTLSVPLGRRDSIKIAAHTGAYTRVGADFDIGSLTYLRRLGPPGAGPPPADDQ
jgi:hypothetical protein